MVNAAYLKKIRVDRGFSQKEAEEFAHITHWSRFESGNEAMSLRVRKRIAVAFDVPADLIAHELLNAESTSATTPVAPAAASKGSPYHTGDRGTATANQIADQPDVREAEVARLHAENAMLKAENAMLKAELDRKRQLVCDLADELNELKKRRRCRDD